MISLSFAHPCRLCAAAVSMSLLAGCSTLGSTATPPSSFYALDGTRGEAPGGATAATRPPRAASMAATARSRHWRNGEAAPTLIVNPPHASSGFDSKRVIYVRGAHQLEYFAHAEWVDTPARMIVPLIVAAMDKSATFRAVVMTPSAAAGDLRLDTEIIRLQQEFGSQPSRVRFTLRATLADSATRRVLAWREFDETVAAASADPRGGVAAANLAVHAALEHLAAFCAETAALWRPASAAGATPITNTATGR